MSVFSVVFALLLHEGTHYLTARAFGLNPKIRMKWTGAEVSYVNKTENNLANLAVSASAPLLMIGVGLCVPASFEWLVFKIICLINLLNLTPLTNDGEVFLLSLRNLWRMKHAKK
jgi:hypothetical protein